MIKLCIAIPNYNHGKTIDKLLTQLADYQLPCLLVDDGSDSETKSLLKAAADKFTWITLVTLPHNLGKGGAMQAAFTHAKALGYTHLLQIDADGQHNTQDIPRLLEKHRLYPDALITGVPVYDASVPRSRLYGRKVTQFWVTVETLSTQIQDAMCGFRIYPIAPTMQVIRQQNVGMRMDFDIAILVRLAWQGVTIISIPTHVSYPVDGISHFQLWRDNLRISRMHTRLFFGMLLRLPRLVKRKLQKTPANQNQVTTSRDTKKQWHQMQERGTKTGLNLMLSCYRLLGKRVTYLLLYPVTAYFFVFNKTARTASKNYLEKLKQTTKINTEQVSCTSISSLNKLTHIDKKALSSFQHLMAFSQSIVDKLAVWNNDIHLQHIEFHGHALLSKLLEEKQGAVIFTAHLGNIEIARALSRFIPELKVNALVFNRHAININHLLNQINQDYRFNMIEVQTMDIALAIQLQEKIDAGELIVIAGDRTSISKPERSLTVSFLNHPAELPEGAFMLASLLKCPIYMMLCLKETLRQSTPKFSLYFTHLFDAMPIDRKQRQKSLTHYAQCFADRLTDYCEKYPLQWFNFYDFWHHSKNNPIIRDKS